MEAIDPLAPCSSPSVFIPLTGGGFDGSASIAGMRCGVFAPPIPVGRDSRGFVSKFEAWRSDNSFRGRRQSLPDLRNRTGNDDSRRPTTIAYVGRRVLSRTPFGPSSRHGPVTSGTHVGRLKLGSYCALPGRDHRPCGRGAPGRLPNRFTPHSTPAPRRGNSDDTKTRTAPRRLRPAHDSMRAGGHADGAMCVARIAPFFLRESGRTADPCCDPTTLRPSPCRPDCSRRSE